MVELIARNPCDGLLPIEAGTCRLSGVLPAHITSIMPYRRQEKQVSAALKAAYGMAFPAPNRALGKDDARCVWTGQGQAMLLGPVADKSLAKNAALVDQSDGWAVVRLEGAGAGAVLARLTPLDLRPVVFKRGHTARSELAHMMVSVTRIGVQAFQIMGFRSMAKTLVHELHGAMKSVAAQG